MSHHLWWLAAGSLFFSLLLTSHLLLLLLLVLLLLLLHLLLFSHARRRVYLTALDLVDGTPILDIKPYVTAYDSLPTAKTPAWCGTVPESIRTAEEGTGSKEVANDGNNSRGGNSGGVISSATVLFDPAAAAAIDSAAAGGKLRFYNGGESVRRAISELLRSDVRPAQSYRAYGNGKGKGKGKGRGRGKIEGNGEGEGEAKPPGKREGEVKDGEGKGQDKEINRREERHKRRTCRFRFDMLLVSFLRSPEPGVAARVIGVEVENEEDDRAIREGLRPRYMVDA